MHHIREGCTLEERVEARRKITDKYGKFETTLRRRKTLVSDDWAQEVLRREEMVNDNEYNK